MYWKASYQRAESERLRLYSELDQLKRERDTLRSREDSQRPRGQAALGKRKRDTPASGTNKRNKHEIGDELDFEDHIDLEIGNINAPSLGISSNVQCWADADFL